VSTKIQWTDDPWNVVIGCKECSPGCRHCYAAVLAHRAMQPAHEGLTVLKSNGVQWNGKVNIVPERLSVPLHWRKPRRVFICSMSDLFYDQVPFEYVAAVFAVMAACREHTFQVLTKRPKRMAEFLRWIVGEGSRGYVWQTMFEYARQYDVDLSDRMGSPWPWPLPNVWLGTSAEDQRRYDERIVHLLDCPAAIRFLSCEPLLSRIELGLGRNPPGQRMLRWDKSVCHDLHWVIAGGESGQKARPCAMEWIEEIIDECKRFDVACFVKQLGSTVVAEERAADTVEEAQAMLGPQKRDRWLWYAGLAHGQGADPDEWPEEFRVREFPRERPFPLAEDTSARA
jgi:protein gp37